MKSLTQKQKAELVGDFHTYGGALALSAGASWAWPPAGPMVFGFVLMALGLFWRGR